ncbi:MAG: hypothetical protein EOO40_11700 [Deltaproteobacteria bacterium]|nr:MAG: hypothetical protein EOO40_11700 [Deltaproteobacteria bacterium]
MRRGRFSCWLIDAVRLGQIRRRAIAVAVLLVRHSSLLQDSEWVLVDLLRQPESSLFRALWQLVHVALSCKVLPAITRAAIMAMRARQQSVNAIILADPDVESMVSFVGAANGSSGNTGQMFISLKDRAVRQSSSDAVIARLRPKLGKLADITAYLQSMQDVRVGGRAARTQYQYTVQSANLADLKVWAPRLLEAFAKIPMLKDVASDQQTAGLQLNVAIDRDTASRLGITPQAVDDALYDAWGQRQVSVIYPGLNQYRVVLEVDPQYQKGPESLAASFVAAPGGPVPLGAVTRYDAAFTPLAINHQG